MKRLFTFGCSYTTWTWPTWADMLAADFDQHLNYAIRGSGNMSIAHRVSECLINNNITKNDVIIIQWTDYHRFDIHLPNLTKNSNWAGGGNIFNNQYIPEDIKRSWNEYSYVLYTLNNINMTINLLKNSKCKWYMTFRIDLLGDIPKFSNLKNYQKIFDIDNFLKPIDDYVPRKEYKGIKLPKELVKLGTGEYDAHPTTIHHRNWLMDNLGNKLSLEKSKTVFSEYDEMFNEIYNTDILSDQIKWKLLEQETNWTQEKNIIKGL